MRIPMMAVALMLGVSVQIQAAEPEPSGAAAALANAQSVELGGGVVLPRPAFEEIMSRPDGLATLERMHMRNQESQSFEGMPQLILIFVCVLLFFGLSMLYYQRKHARLHRTIQLMVEKGVPIPPEILRAAESTESRDESVAGTVAASIAPPWASNLLWGGLLWITIGVTAMLFLWLRGSDSWPWGIAAVVYGAAAALTAVRHRNGKS